MHVTTPPKTRGVSRPCGAAPTRSLYLLSWRRRDREREGIANLATPEGSRRHGQHDPLPCGRLDLHLIGGRIDRGYCGIHLPLGRVRLSKGGGPVDDITTRE